MKQVEQQHNCRTLVLRGWETKDSKYVYAVHVMFTNHPPCIFLIQLFYNNVVFGALLGWVRRHLRFTHTLSLNPGVMWG